MKLFFARMRAAARIARALGSVSGHDRRCMQGMKGTGFSPYIRSTRNARALQAAENPLGGPSESRSVPQGLNRLRKNSSWAVEGPQKYPSGAKEAAEKLALELDCPEKRSSGAKAPLILRRLSARLKSCPFKTDAFMSFSAACKAHVDFAGFFGTTKVEPCYKAPWQGVFPQPVKPHVQFGSLFSARLKSCARYKARAESFLTAILVFVALPAFGQASSAPAPHSNSQVIYSRSTDENGQTTTTTGPGANMPAPAAAQPIATDAERSAVTFTDFDMDVHLRPADQYIAARAVITVRNDGKTPLAHVPLQISSSLNWERIRTEGHDVSFKVATLNSDTDHTGQLHEAAVPLTHPLAPGATLQLDVTYSGTIAPNAQRLLAIGTPEDIALHSDWDVISPSFTGLRGFGDVVWYPVSSVPVILGDGARLFDEMGEHKLSMAGAHFRLQLAEEFPDGQAPTIALINGHPAALTVTGGSDDVPGVATAALDNSTLGFEEPSLFVAVREAKQATDTTLWTLPADEAAVPAWSDATAAVTPFLQGWLGKDPRSQLTVLDLPDPEDAPFETGALLATAIRPATPDVLEAALAHALTHAFLCTSTQSPPAWLSEGVAHFMGTLWVEKESGRARALEILEAQRQALALAEPASPGTSPGQPLAQAISPIYYRTKAAYVLWMLRDLAGDDALSAALRAYDPEADASKGYGRDGSVGNFEKLVEQASIRRDLKWFFADWVDADKGLPDLSIAKVYTEPAKAGNTLVGVTVANAGYASAEVPITVSTTGTSITQRVVVPARGQIVQRILILGTPTQVQVNDGTVPEVEASVHVTTIGNQADSSSSSSQQGVPQ